MSLSPLSKSTVTIGRNNQATIGLATHFETSFSSLDIDAVLSSSIFQGWAKRVDPRFLVTDFEILHVAYKQNQAGKTAVLFIYAKVTYERPGSMARRECVVMLRGSSVAMLNILRCEGKEYTTLAVQDRIASGLFDYHEIAAGTMEGHAPFLDQAERENEEELGLTGYTRVVDMTELVYGPHCQGIFSTPGGCDEFIRYFAMIYDVTPEDIAALQSRQGGLASEGECIRCLVIPLEDLVHMAPDAKSITAKGLYDLLKQEGNLP